MEDVACRRLLDEAKNYQLLQLPTPVRPDVQGLRFRPRNPIKYNEVLYVVGGSVGGLCDCKSLDSVERLDPGEPNPSWQRVASMTKRRGRLGVAVLDNFLYAVGGVCGEATLNSIERYNPATNKWSNDVAPMLTRREAFGLAALDGFLYAVGGSNGSLKYLDSVECYDVRRNEWTRVAPLGSCRGEVSVSVLNGCLYAVGGYVTQAYLNIVERLDPRMVEKYDPLSDKWTTVTALNCKRHAVGMAVVNGRMYALGGHDGDCQLNTVEVYDPEANQWSLHSSMNDRRWGAGVGVIRMP
ncbi:Kelch repeat type 1 domain containing protein [Trichostrongylus colubriformis]|uniref:Kelch repeat type 1 domain containing protein n=1 Tax=Trichostrongylus colubriformis TaxID=6319 RepID=A0AAN8FKW8_TRICO